MQGNYDPVAGFYDRLARLVFGDSIYQAHLFLLKAIPAEANILIVGGGTGWILEEISKIHKQGLKITYVEISEKMIDKSRKRNAGENHVKFICSPIQEAALEESYNVIITPFLFDNFSDETLKLVFNKVNQHLLSTGHWLFTDFQSQEENFSSKVLLRLMYLFFGFFCKLETSRLPDSTTLFYQNGYTAVDHQEFYNGFICSFIYQKTT